jgi:hypothetical protein
MSESNPARQARTFTQTIDTLRFGTLSDELTDKLRELVATCASTGKAGALTLQIALKPGKGGQIEIFDDIKLKLPKPEKGSSLMFATPDNNLSRDDPRQMQLPGLRTVTDQATGEIRKVS